MENNKIEEGRIIEFVEFTGIGLVCPACGKIIYENPRVVEAKEKHVCSCGEIFYVDADSNVEEKNV